MKPKPPFFEEIKLIKQYVNSDSICLDIGANIGQFTTFLASIAKKVYAFEPEPYNYGQLVTNIEDIEHWTNIETFRMAVNDDNNIMNTTLYTCPSDNGMHRLYPSKWCEGGERIKVQTTTIDQFAKWFLVDDKLSFVKVDVEGYEYHVIKGMLNTIERDEPVIMMEWHPPTLIEAKTNPRDFYYNMLARGYNNPKHMLLNKDINSYEELFNYTNDIPAINVLWVPKK